MRYPKYQLASEIVAAGELAKVGARTRVLKYTTALPLQTIRQVIKDATGTGPVTGPYGDPLRWFLESYIRMSHGRLFYFIYHRCSKPHAATRLLHSFRLYKKTVPKMVLDINMAYGIVFLVNHGMLIERRCDDCDTAFFTIANGSNTCQACQLYKRMHCRSCGAPLPSYAKQRGKGRRREYCDDCNHNRARERLRHGRKDEYHSSIYSMKAIS